MSIVCIAIASCLNFLIPLALDANSRLENKQYKDDAPPDSPYGVVIPRGKVVPLHSVQISDEEEKAISRGISGA
jgi:hypothetical protein